MSATVVDRWGQGDPSANLGLELTTRCNSTCGYCFAREGLVREASLPLSLAIQICTEGYQAGYRHLHLTGGEPLLWEGLLDLVEAGLAQGYRSIFLNSNATLFSPDVVRRLARYPRLAVSVSLQGDAAQHDRLRGSGAYRRAVRGLASALAAGLSVTVFTAVGKTLLADLAAFAAGVHTTFPGIQRLTLIQMMPVRGQPIDWADELLEPEDFLRLVRTVAALNLFGWKTDVLNAPLATVTADFLHMPWIPRSQPRHRPGRLMVRANREITLTHSARANFGRYQPGMLAKVLDGEAYCAAVAPDDVVCPTCRFVGRCRAHGLTQPAFGAGGRRSSGPYCQRVLSQTAVDTRASKEDPAGIHLPAQPAT